MSDRKEKERKIIIKHETQKESVFDVILKVAQILSSIIASIAAIIGVCTAKEVISMINEQNQSQIQTQDQTQIVIEPREGDIIVTVGNNYKLLQLINSSDITFPSKIQEIQYKYSDEKIKDKRVDVNNINNENWSKNDSFSYMINNFSINPNKIINLVENINSITIYCDFYSEKNISTYVNLGEKNFFFTMISNDNKSDFRISNINEVSTYSYVTNEINNGFEWAKIRVEIEYYINEKTIRDSISSDWIPTDADIS